MSFWQVVGAVCLGMVALGLLQLIGWVVLVTAFTFATRRKRRAS